MKVSPCVGLFCEVNMRNDLLAAIVEQSGGTVTDPNNRNLLLNDWLEAVKSTPTVDYVARLDGLSQYWQLSEAVTIPASTDFEISLGIETTYGTSSSWISIFEGSDFNLWFSKGGGFIDDITVEIKGARSKSGIRWSEGGLKTLGVYRVGSTITINYNDESFQFEEEGGFSIDSLCSFNGQDYLEGCVKNLLISIGGDDVLNIPLTNKAQGATQQPTIGIVTATMPNYSSDVWEEV